MRRMIYQIGNNVATHMHSASISIVQFVRSSSLWLLKFTSRALEYCFGMYIGALFGWLGGWCTGHIYIEYFEPVYFSDFSGLGEIMCWDQMPYIFAGAGIFVGGIIGAAVVFCFSHKSGDKGSNY